MGVNPRQFVLLVLEAAGHEIRGKTYLQKLCFFVGVKTGNSALGYRPHYYGPYSDLVASEVSFLKSAGFVSERQRASGVSDSSGWEVSRYDYSITEEGKLVVESLKSAYPEDYSAISGAVADLSAAGKVDYMALSLAAKAYWIVSQNRNEPVPIQAIADEAEHLSWKISSAQVSNAIDFLTKLNLVTAAN